MKYLAFKSSVAVMACLHICNYAIAGNVKLTVEHVAPHVVELPQVIAEDQRKIIMAVAEKFDGYLTDEIPSPLDFFNPQPAQPRTKPASEGYDYNAAAIYSANRALGNQTLAQRRRARNVIELPARHPDNQLAWRAA
ncbi:hypothetical protein D3C73_1243070 [compost metagenome]